MILTNCSVTENLAILKTFGYLDSILLTSYSDGEMVFFIASASLIS